MQHLWFLFLAFAVIGFSIGLLVGMALMKWFVKSNGDPEGFIELWDDVDDKLRKRG